MEWPEYMTWQNPKCRSYTLDTGCKNVKDTNIHSSNLSNRLHGAVFLKNIRGAQLLKKFHAFYGTWRVHYNAQKTTYPWYSNIGTISDSINSRKFSTVLMMAYNSFDYRVLDLSTIRYSNLKGHNVSESGSVCPRLKGWKHLHFKLHQKELTSITGQVI
jgi:hypothetical protein